MVQSSPFITIIVEGVSFDFETKTKSFNWVLVNLESNFQVGNLSARGMEGCSRETNAKWQSRTCHKVSTCLYLFSLSAKFQSTATSLASCFLSSKRTKQRTRTAIFLLLVVKHAWKANKKVETWKWNTSYKENRK